MSFPYFALLLHDIIAQEIPDIVNNGMTGLLPAPTYLQSLEDSMLFSHFAPLSCCNIQIASPLTFIIFLALIQVEPRVSDP